MTGFVDRTQPAPGAYSDWGHRSSQPNGRAILSTMSIPAIDIEAMSPAERLRLISDLWDSLPDDEVGLTDEQRIELDRRLDDLDADIAAGRSLGSEWVDVRARLGSRSTRK